MKESHPEQAREVGSSESVTDIAEWSDRQVNGEAEVNDQKFLQRLKSVLESWAQKPGMDV